MAEKGKGKASSSANPSTWLPRGKACLNCRLRKIKCDGMSPKCGPCTKDGHRDCEYQSEGPSSTHGLEQRVAELRTRLRDLELNKGEVTSQQALLSGSVSPENSRADACEFILSDDETKILTDLFFEHEQPLWFLHRERFRDAAQRPIEDPRRAHTALISVVCAIATRYASSDLGCLETGLLNVSLQTIHNVLAVGGAAYEDNVLHVLQARALLGGVLAQTGQTLQCATVLDCCALTQMLGLNGASETRAVVAASMIDPVILEPLPSPASKTGLAERAGAFWAIKTLNALWATARGSGSRGRLNMQRFTVPWPATPEFAEEADFTRLAAGPHTVQSFLFGLGPPPIWTGDNAIELISTATELLASAVHSRSVPLPDDYTPFSATLPLPHASGDPLDFEAIERRADALAAALGPTLMTDVRTHPAHVLLRGVILEIRMTPGDPRAVNAARALASASPALLRSSSTPGFMEPAIGMVVPAACRALLSARAASTEGGNTQSIDVAFDALQGVLEAWVPHSAYIATQCERVQQESAVTYT